MYVCYLFVWLVGWLSQLVIQLKHHFWNLFGQNSVYLEVKSFDLDLVSASYLLSFCLSFFQKLKGKSWPETERQHETAVGISRLITSENFIVTSLLSWLTHMYSDSCTMTCKAAGTLCHLFAVQIFTAPHKKVRGWTAMFDNAAQRHTRSLNACDRRTGGRPFDPMPAWTHITQSELKQIPCGFNLSVSFPCSVWHRDNN